MAKVSSHPVSRGIIVAVLFAFTAILPTTVVGDGAVPFTINLRSSTLQPVNATIEAGDSISWRNVDSTEHITHRVVYDHDGDGLYNGSMDWDSGNLSRSCELHENGTKVDSNCEVVFEMHFNATWQNASYNYQDILSNSTVNNGTITVLAGHDESDGHTDTDNVHDDGHGGSHEHGVDAQTGESDSRNWLLWLAGGSGVASLLLFSMLWSGMKDEDTELDDGEDEKAVKADSDIDQIGEEE